MSCHHKTQRDIPDDTVTSTASWKCHCCLAKLCGYLVICVITWTMWCNYTVTPAAVKKLLIKPHPYTKHLWLTGWPFHSRFHTVQNLVHLK